MEHVKAGNVVCSEQTAVHCTVKSSADTDSTSTWYLARPADQQ